MGSAEKAFLPIRPPATTFNDDPHAVLSPAEQKMYDEVLGHLTRTTPVYTIPNIEKGELTEDEKFWISRECILRYLRASKWKVSNAIHRLEGTLKWRREYGIYDVVSAQHVEPEAVTGKAVIYGYDVAGKPAFYMIPSRQNTDEATRQIQFTVWMLERCVDLMEPGVETLALLINFADKAKNPSVSTALSVLSILQNHYPERLGLALVINVPFLVNAFFKIVMPFVDPITRNKVKFNPKIFEDGFFKTDMVMKEWGGSRNFEYVHEKYWPDFVSTCEKRVKTWKDNWKVLGSKVGISEWDYKKGNAFAGPSVIQEKETKKEDKKVEDMKKAEDTDEAAEVDGVAPTDSAVTLSDTMVASQPPVEPTSNGYSPTADPPTPPSPVEKKEEHHHEHHTGPADIPSTAQPTAGGHSVTAVSGAGAVAGSAGGGSTINNDSGPGPSGDAGGDSGAGGGDAGGGDAGGD
ncbi:hypothetical protein GALMADRAFT_247498 [Galerina marginata CBS 339.88]|uniref:CRAL-TRIO domain-containing protein n=1 Tax=Galerina marginata (strain CBS 339.88) TaxID=685588 RepID=A0A067SZ47_GALM3|nr:hypothetical protein GALMADRAFT_247498 [Galerina marginata CBS 339.88]